MIIKNANEARRIEYALEDITDGFGRTCHRFVTHDDCQCTNAMGTAGELNDFCSRMFPKILKLNGCPCSEYSKKYIKSKCRQELTKWRNR